MVLKDRVRPKGHRHGDVLPLLASLATCLRGKETIEHGNPFDGKTGLLGFASGYRAMEDCDALLMLGTHFPHQ